jgi:hypothetical protein
MSLDSTKHEIRPLKLNLTRSHSPLQARLVTHSLNCRPEYMTLSYSARRVRGIKSIRQGNIVGGYRGPIRKILHRPSLASRPQIL